MTVLIRKSDGKCITEHRMGDYRSVSGVLLPFVVETTSSARRMAQHVFRAPYHSGGERNPAGEVFPDVDRNNTERLWNGTGRVVAPGTENEVHFVSSQGFEVVKYEMARIEKIEVNVPVDENLFVGPPKSLSSGSSAQTLPR